MSRISEHPNKDRRLAEICCHRVHTAGVHHSCLHVKMQIENIDAAYGGTNIVTAARKLLTTYDR